jgi:hypothetical protein
MLQIPDEHSSLVRQGPNAIGDPAVPPPVDDDPLEVEVKPLAPVAESAAVTAVPIDD